jgi:hypothetical protein
VIFRNWEWEQNFELFPASGKTLAERLRVLAASCEELRARTGNPPLDLQLSSTLIVFERVGILIRVFATRWYPVNFHANSLLNSHHWLSLSFDQGLNLHTWII